MSVSNISCAHWFCVMYDYMVFQNFTVIYVKMGFPRLEPSKQTELAIPLLLSIEDSPTSHQDS